MLWVSIRYGLISWSYECLIASEQEDDPPFEPAALTDEIVDVQRRILSATALKTWDLSHVQRMLERKELLLDYVKSPSLRHIRDPHSVIKLAPEHIQYPWQ